MADKVVLNYETCGEWTIRGKGIIEGAKTLDQAADMAEEFARSLRQMKKDGWKLTNPVVDDYGFCERKKEWLRKHPKEAAEIAKELAKQRGE